MDSVQLFLILTGLAVVFFVWWRMRWKKQHEEWERTGGARSVERDSTGEIRDSARKLLIDIEETSRAVNAQLGTKMKVLDELLREADKKIARLEELQGKSPLTASAPPRPVQTAAPKPGEQALDNALKDVLDPAKGDEKMKDIFRRADSGEDSIAISKATGVPRGEVELMLSLRSRRK